MTETYPPQVALRVRLRVALCNDTNDKGTAMTLNEKIRRDIREMGQGPCICLPRELCQLSAAAMALVVDMAADCVRVRNGNMTVVFSDYSARHNNTYRSRTMLRRALREAIDAGFVARTSCPAGKRHTYAITWVELGAPRSVRHSMYPIEGWKPRRQPGASHIPRQSTVKGGAR